MLEVKSLSKQHTYAWSKQLGSKTFLEKHLSHQWAELPYTHKLWFI